jgi:hypothetical protein
MDMTTTLNAHRGELQDAGAGIYHLTAAVAAGNPAEGPREEVQAAAAALADSVMWQELPMGAEAARDAGAWLLTLEPAQAARVLKAWRAMLESADSRRAKQAVLDAFPSWVRKAPAEQAEAWLDVLPALGPAAAKPGPAAIESAITRGSRIDDDDDRHRYLQCLRAYGNTTAPIFSALLHLGEVTEQLGAWRELEELVRAVPVSAMEEHADAEHLVPALSGLCRAAAVHGADTLRAAWRLCLVLAGMNPSSARPAARGLTRVLGRLEADVAAGFLREVGHLLETAGPRAVGFALRELPAWLKRRGPEKVAGLLDAARRLARTDGAAAAMAFLEGKTAAARRALRP